MIAKMPRTAAIAHQKWLSNCASTNMALNFVQLSYSLYRLATKEMNKALFSLNNTDF
ncbi:MAG: hypothetical protein RLZZ38_786 [Bacteroidota bacterium]